MAGTFDLKKAFAGLATRMKKDKRVETAVYGGLILLGAAIFFIGSANGGQKAETSANAQAEKTARTAEETESRLEEVLSSIRGAGKVQVMITYDTGKELVPAMSTDTQAGTTETTGSDAHSITQNNTESSQPATISGSGGSETIILTEIQPKVRGVIVIAEGAADISVKLRLQNAVQTVLGVKADQIEVFEMKATGGEEQTK